jgi:ABC-2 type transport system ATP-binding protein
MSTEPDVIRTHLLTKSYGGAPAVRDLTFTVPAGSIFGLLGRNGSGKTTTLRLLLGLLWPDAGSSAVLGENSLTLSSRCRRRIGYLSDEPFPYDDLPLRELVRFVAAFFPVWDWDYTNQLIRRFDLPDYSLKGMSAGQRRLAELMLVLAQKPDLLILDDPAEGLDVIVRREFLSAALDLVRQEGKTVLLTSHILGDVERIVDMVAFLHKGSLLRPPACLDDLKEQTKRLILPLADGVGLEPLPGEWTRRREKDCLAVVVEAFTRAREEELRKRFPTLEVEDLNLESLFTEFLSGAEGGRCPFPLPRSERVKA